MLMFRNVFIAHFDQAPKYTSLQCVREIDFNALIFKQKLPP